MIEALFTLNGKVALVTGANGGIGRAVALAFQRAGAHVVVTGRDPVKNQVIGEELGDPSLVMRLDVRDEAAVAHSVDQVLKRFQQLDILVNNAGITPIWVGSVVEHPLADWETVLATNLTGPFLCAKYAARAMVARAQGGKIINVGSVYAQFGPPDFVSYPASKAGIRGLTHALAVELAPHNIQVNTLEPGWIETDGTTGVPAWLREEIRMKTPAGRWGQPDDIVGAALFLASSASNFVTGITMQIDGGYTIADRLRH